MGCDIHYILEHKFEDRWVGLMCTSFRVDHTFESWSRNIAAAGNGAPSIKISATDYQYPELKGRHYAFFAALAGVRGPGPEPNGIPADPSDMTRMVDDYWSGDGHSHGHCSLGHFCMTRLRFDDEAAYTEIVADMLKDPKAVRRAIERYVAIPSLDDDYSGVRVVYFFDN